ncbi:MAG: tetratricopeptide repeat protein [Oligoflexia bacterium]|nr:tetratricopeptide repeat protein [Oligoflexia bacterium]
MINGESAAIAALGQRFMVALGRVRKGDIDGAADELRAILAVGPRLAEPRLELARLLLVTGQVEEAADQAEEAAQILDQDGVWTLNLSEAVVKSVAWDIHGEALRQQADRDDIVFGDPEQWKDLTNRARAAFQRAARLDPKNAHAVYWAGGTDAELLPEGIEDTAPVGLTFELPTGET